MGAHAAIVVRAIRRQNGWSREELARMTGVSVAFVERVERGEEEPGKHFILRLGEAIGADLSRISG